MKVTYDREADALYITFKEAMVTTRPLGDGIAVDYDADGRVAGIEVLSATWHLGDPTALAQVVFEDVTREGP